jgi:hypothetical protein
MGAATIGYDRPVVIGARKISKHRTAVTFGAYLAIFAIVVIVALLIALPGLRAALNADFTLSTSVSPVSRPVQILTGIGSSLVTVTGWMWLAGVGSYTVKNYLGTQSQSDVFN